MYLYIIIMYKYNSVKKNDMVTPKNSFANVRDKEVEFSCYSRVDAVWTFNGKSLPYNVETGRVLNSFESWLKIIDIRTKHKGIYTCTTEENYVIYEDDVKLEVVGRG